MEVSAENSTDTRAVNADCSAGKVAIGGGADLGSLLTLPNNVALTASRRVDIPGFEGWTAKAHETGLGTTGSWSLFVEAICVDAP